MTDVGLVDRLATRGATCPPRAAVVALLLTLAGIAPVSACGEAEIATLDSVWYGWNGARVLCAAPLDASDASLDNLLDGIRAAPTRDQVLLLFGHAPGRHFSVARLEAILRAAADAGVPFLTFDQLSGPTPPTGQRAGLLLSFDDASVQAWYDVRELLDRYGARVTFFVSRYHRLSQRRRDQLRELAERGHEIANHSVGHLRAVEYVRAHGLRAYLADEIEPAIAELAADGYAPLAFAYPHGERSSEIDAALLDRFDVVRSISFLVDSPFVADPCPD